MATSEYELGNWLVNNEALAGTEDYEQKADLFINMTDKTARKKTEDSLGRKQQHGGLHARCCSRRYF